MFSIETLLQLSFTSIFLCALFIVEYVKNRKNNAGLIFLSNLIDFSSYSYQLKPLFYLDRINTKAEKKLPLFQIMLQLKN